MRITVNQFKSIQKFDSNLYHALLGVTRSVGNNTVEIDESHALIGEAFQKAFSEWLKANNIAEAPAPPPHNDACSCNECFQRRVAEQQRSEKARLEVEKQNLPGQLRLNEYMTQAQADGRVLLNNDFNRDVFFKFLDEKFPGLQVITPKLVDVFVAAKRLELQWGAPPVPAAPTPTPVEPEPVFLSDGSEQLPIDAIPGTKHTVIQLRDLDARQRALKAGESTLAPLENGEPRLPLGTAPSPRHSVAQRRDLERRTARTWARQSGSHGGSFFSSDSQVR